MRPIPQIQHTPAASPYNTHYPAFSQVAADEIRKSQWAADVHQYKQDELQHEQFMRDWAEAEKRDYSERPAHHHARHRK
jgi:hypothetical protein